MADTVVSKIYRVLRDSSSSAWDKISFWSKAADTEAADGKSLETKVGAVDGITSDITSTSEKFAASIKSVHDLNNNLGGLTFSVVDGKPYVKVGADSPRPFRGGIDDKVVLIDSTNVRGASVTCPSSYAGQYGILIASSYRTDYESTGGWEYDTNNIFVTSGEVQTFSWGANRAVVRVYYGKMSAGTYSFYINHGDQDCRIALYAMNPPSDSISQVDLVKVDSVTDSLNFNIDTKAEAEGKMGVLIQCVERFDYPGIYDLENAHSLNQTIFNYHSVYESGSCSGMIVRLYYGILNKSGYFNTKTTYNSGNYAGFMQLLAFD